MAEASGNQPMMGSCDLVTEPGKAMVEKSLGTLSRAEGKPIALVPSDGDFTNVSGLGVEKERDGGAGTQTQRLSHNGNWQ